MPSLISRILPRRFKSSQVEIPVVRLNGAIMSGNSVLRQNLSLEGVATQLEKAFTTKHSPAVALSINSPGGSPVQSRLIYKRIRDLAEENNKKVHVFVEDVAASGGYMIAVAGDEIIADPSSIVGSIGVISASFGFTELIKKIGVERRVYTAGKNKATMDSFQPEKASDVEHLKALQLEIHQTFIDMVKARRGTKLQDNEDLFTGQFWTAVTGLQLGLVDGLGDIRSHLRTVYGEKTKLNLIQPSRGLLNRKNTGSIYHGQLLGAAGESLLNVLEEKSLWSRYGL